MNPIVLSSGTTGISITDVLANFSTVISKVVDACTGNPVTMAIIGMNSNIGDNEVLATLSCIVNKDVLLSVLNIDDKPVITGLSPVAPVGK